VQRFKRGLAALLAAVMIATLLPVATAAEDNPELPEELVPPAAVTMPDDESENAEVPDQAESPDAEQAETAEETGEPDDVQEPVPASAEEAEAEVVYNTGSMEITVGSEPDDSRERMYYDTFDENGEYTIWIHEPNPFFPYEVQFTYAGQTWSEWFETPEDTAEVGGHLFRTACSGEPEYLGFQVGKYYIPAYPEEKQFTTAQNYGSADYDPDAGITPASLLPLEEVNVYVDFSGFLPEELTEISIRAFLDGQALDDRDTVLWIKTDDNYERYRADGSVDLSAFARDTGSGTASTTAEIIAGAFDQLNPDNTRYIVRFNVSYFGQLLEMQAYSSDRRLIGSDTSASSDYVRQEDGSYEEYPYYSMTGYDYPVWELRSALVGLRFCEQSSTLKKLREKGELTIDIYGGKLDDISEEEPINDQIWNQEDLSATGGYTMDATQRGNAWVTVALGHNGKTHLMYRTLEIGYHETYQYLEFGFRAVKEDGTEWETQKNFWPYIERGSDVLQYNVSVISDEWDGKKTGIAMTYNDRYAENGLSAAVYEGIYQSETEALQKRARDISEQFWGPDASGYQKDYNKAVPFTVVLKKGETVVETIHIQVTTALNQERIFVSPASDLYSNNREERVTSKFEQADNGTYFYTMRYYGSWLSLEYPKDGQYYISLYASTNYPHEEDYVDGRDDVKAAYLGNYATAEEAEGQTDIKGQLFSYINHEYDSEAGGYIYTGGYLADFRNGAVTFTIVDIKDKVYHVTVNTLTAVPPKAAPASIDTYFRVTGVTDLDGNPYDQYVVKSEDDGYYFNGFQTIFLLNPDGSPVADREIIPVFSTGTAVKPYVGHNEKSGIIVKEGNKEIFANGTPIHYSAASESGTHLRNYWVTFLTQEQGAKLYVNGMNDVEHYEEGMPVREVLLGAGSSDFHDILIANTGSEKLTGLYARLEGAENICLDDYWTIGNTKELAAFTGVAQTSAYGDLNNLAKIRLHRTKDAAGNFTHGEIKGTLVIGSTGTGEEVKIKLSGTAGIPKITTEAVVDGVQFVPYSSVIQTNHMYGASGVRFELVSGTLPSGVIVRQNGEVYGVPRNYGDFSFAVRATYDGQVSEVKSFRLHIAPNEDPNVFNASDPSYKLLEPVGNPVEDQMTGPYHFELDASELEKDGTHTFASEGPYIYYIDFWLDGVKLKRGVDYEASEGSTILTLADSTIEDKGNGTHTLAAEFREGDKETGELKRTAQNYTITGLPEPEKPSKPSGGGDHSGGGSDKPSTSKPSSSKPSETKPTTPVTPPPDTGMPFTDVLPPHWFFNDVKWVYDNKYMEGVSATLFAPAQPITQATIVTVLARLAKIDLTQFDGETYPGIENGKWYTQPAIWATQSGLLPDFSSFTGESPLDRNGMAIMLVKYMRSLGLDTTPPEQPAVFSDAALMTQEGNDAFQILYQYNIFRGVGGNAMDPAGSTTRAQFAALVQRISAFAATSQ